MSQPKFKSVTRSYVSVADGDEWRNTSAQDEAWVIVDALRDPCARLLGVGMSARSNSSPFEPVTATATLAVYLMRRSDVAEAKETADGNLGIFARELREIVERETLGGIVYSETIPREFYEDLSDSIHARHRVCDSKGGEYVLAFYWSQADTVAHNFRGFYDVGVC